MAIPVQIGFIGFGYWGPNVLRNVYQNPRAKVVKASDSFAPNAQRLAEAYPNIPVTLNPEEVLDAEEVEAVCIATPAESHYALTKAALERGKHVLVEKPISILPEEAQELSDLAERQQCVLMVGHIYEYNVPINKVKEYLDSGYLGKINYVVANRTSLGPRIRTDVNVVWDYAIHDIYLLTYLFGGKPHSVRATGYGCLQPSIEDAVFIDLNFANNVLVNIHCSWYEPLKRRDMTIIGSERMLLYNDMEIDDRVKIFNRGFAPLDGNDRYGNRNLRLFDDGITIPHLDWREPLQVEVEHFLNCIINGTPPRSDGLDGKRTLEIIHAVNESLRRGGIEIAT
jgi:predicted dehydrogenase